MRLRTALKALASTALIVIPVQVSAQSFDPKTLVVLGMKESARDLPLSIYLKPGLWPEVVVAVPQGTTPQQLAAAFRLMYKVVTDYKQSPSDTAQNSFIHVKVPLDAAERRLDEEQLRFYSGYIASFPKALLVDVPGVGTGRAVEVRMPNWQQ